ncbi:hypothetical protein [Kineosporia sp. A_224]|uniref:hypothetical protein n=1 Tax=Kineosporia sp. A_224 TaxID=1962180 RepID=UPI000B4A86B4|nr:hypothetical protein [Kineosporia sp. A_224]
MGYEWVWEVLDKLIGVEPHEVSQVLAARRRWPRPAVTVEGFEVLTIWGRTKTGRPLLVALKSKDEWDWWIVGARELDPGETAQLEAWEASND